MATDDFSNFDVLGAIGQPNPEQKLRGNVSAGYADTSPDEVARQRQLAKYVGLNPAIGQYMPEQVKAMAKTQELVDHSVEAPTLRQKYTDPYFMELAHDDAPVLSKVERAVIGAVKFMVSAPGAAGGGLVSTLKRGIYDNGIIASSGLGRMTFELGAAATELVPAMRDLEASGQYGGNPLRRVAEGFALIGQQQAAIKKQSETPASGNVEAGVISGVESAGQNLKYLPLAFMGPPGWATALTGMVAETAGTTYQRDREKGVGIGTATVHAATDALAEYVGERYFGEVGFLKRLAAGAPASKLLMWELTREVPAEVGTTLWQNFNEWALTEPGKSVADFMREQPDAIAQTIIATAVGGAIQTGTGRAAVRAVEGALGRSAEITQALQREESLKQLMAAAAQSKLAERSPEELRAFINEAAGDSAVRFDARLLAETLQQSGIDVAQALPSLDLKALQEQALAGGEVTVKVGDIATGLKDTGLDQTLMEHARLADNSLSAAEAREVQGKLGEELNARLQDALAQAADRDAAEQSHAALKTQFLEQLNAAGRARASVNELQADYLATFFATMGARHGMTAQEFHARFPITIAGAPTAQGEGYNKEAQQGGLTVEGYHYSTADRNAISTQMYGTGLKGSNRDLYLNAADQRLRNRAYFYVDQGTGINPESGVGGRAHRAQLTNIYDSDADPLKLRRGADQLAFESAVLDAGYSGYLARLPGTQSAQAIMLGPQTIPVEQLGGRTNIKAGERVEPLAKPAPTWQVVQSYGTPEQLQAKLERLQANPSWANYELKVEDGKLLSRELTGAVYEQSRVKDVTPAVRKLLKALTPMEQRKVTDSTAAKIIAQLQKLPKAKEMAAVALGGQAKRGWYKQSAEAISAVFGPDAPRFAALLAALSPQCSVETNLLNTLNTWKNWVAAGRPTEREAIINVMGVSVQGGRGRASVLDAWINNSVRALTAENPGGAETTRVLLSGPKVNSFFLNLIGVTDEVTNDAWMANYALVDQVMFSGSMNVLGTDPGKGSGYLAMSARTREAAAYLTKLTGETWTPAEVQETVWSWAKTLYELQVGDLTATRALEEGKLTDELINATPDFSSLFNDPAYAEILKEAGYADQLDTLRSDERAAAGDAGEATDTGGKAAALAPEDQRRLQLQAARRLERLREQRNAGVLNQGGLTDGRPQPTGDRGGRDQGGSLAPLPGAPVIEGATGPDPRLVAVAEQYARAHGIDLRRQGEFVEVDPERAKRIAAAYDAMPHAPNDPQVQEAYADLKRQTWAQYQALLAAGYKFWFMDPEADPYKGNPWNAMRDLRANQSMAVFPTEAGFGSGATDVDISGNPLAERVPGLEWHYGTPDGPLKPVTYNDLFRAVHDAFGHGLEGAGFRARGEENAWQAHVRLFTGPAVGAITSETRGQNSWLNYGPHGEANQTAKVEDTVFADQKTGLMPSWTWEEGRAPDAPRAAGVLEQAAKVDQTETPEFKRWFGDSKVVDAEGKPLVVYHGTRKDFTAFNPDNVGDNFGVDDEGFFFTGSQVLASHYADPESAFAAAGIGLQKGYEPLAGANVLPVYLSIRNPLTLEAYTDAFYTNPVVEIDEQGISLTDYFDDNRKSIMDFVKRGGHDGVVFRHEGKTLAIALRPEQIKSAIGNDGTFDVNDPSILSQEARGTFNPATLELVLNPSADLSTFFHETGHFFLEVLAATGSQPGSPMAQDWAKVLEWVGVSQEQWDAWQAEYASTGAIPAGLVAVHERWAESVEQYIMEGKAPSRELQPLMRKFATWLKSVYGSIKQFLARHGMAAPAGGQTLNQADEIEIRLPDPAPAKQWISKITAGLQRNPLAPRQWVLPVGEEGEFALFELKPDYDYDRTAHILWVQASSGRNGVGTKAMRWLQERAAEDGISLTLSPLADGPVSQPALVKFYKGLGFTKQRRGSKDMIWRPDGVLSQDQPSGPGPQINDDIRRVMDRLLATDEQIAEANEIAGLMPDIEADAEAAERLAKRSIADLKWDVRAVDKVIAKLRKQAKSIEKDIREEVTAQVNAMPEVQAAEQLKKAEAEHEASPVSADFNAAIIADANGFASVDAMYRAIDAFGDKQDVIDGLTSKRMLEEHGDLIDDRAIREAAIEAVHNEARARALATELRTQREMLNVRQATGETTANGRAVTVNALVEAAKQFGQNAVARIPLQDLKTAAWRFTQAERRAGKAWETATAAGKTDEAVQAKQDQMLQNAAAKAAIAARDEAARIFEFFKRVAKGNDEKTVEKGRDPDLVNAARAVLKAYGVNTPTTKTAAEYLELVQEHDPDTFAALAPAVAVAVQNAQPLQALTFEELQALHESVESLWYLAKVNREMEVDGDKLDLQDAEGMLHARMVEIGIPDHIPGETGALTDKEERARKLQFVGALLRRVEQWAEKMDGKFGGPFLRILFRPVKDAATRYKADHIKFRKAFQELVDNVAPLMTHKLIDAPEIGYTFGRGHNGIGHAELLHALLHTGNESNKRKLLLGRGWATELPDGTLDTSKWDALIQRLASSGVLQAEHFNFLQGVWDLLEQTKPLAQKAHRQVFGRYFAEVTADAFVDPFGITRRGGYVPAQADPRLVDDNRVAKQVDIENENASNMFPAPARGFTKARTEYNRPLVLDLRTLPQHIDKVLLFSHMAVPIKAATRLLDRKGVSQALNRIDPAAIPGMLIPWLQRSAKQQVETPFLNDGKISRVLSAVRSRAGAAIMFANVSNTVQQITGLVSAGVKVSPSALLRAAVLGVQGPKALAAQVAKASPYMAARMDDSVTAMDQDIKQLLTNGSLYERAQDWGLRHTYFLQQAFDNVLSPIVWTAAYNDALAKGMEDSEAIAFADGTVRQTQGALSAEDVSKIETGDPVSRMFTQFIGYWNMLGNTNLTALQQLAADGGVPNNKLRALYIVTMGALLPVWIAEAIAVGFKGGPGDADGDGDADTLVDWLAAVIGMGTIKGLFAQVPFIGTLANAAVNRFNSNPADDRLSVSPAISLIEGAAGVPSDIYKLAKGEGSVRTTVRDVGSLVSLTTGLPIAPATRAISYAAGVAEGKITPTGPVDAARGVVTGTASEASKR